MCGITELSEIYVKNINFEVAVFFRYIYFLSARHGYVNKEKSGHQKQDPGAAKFSEDPQSASRESPTQPRGCTTPEGTAMSLELCFWDH